MAGYLRSLKSSVLIGFEATGNYHRPLAYFLHRQGFELRLIPTLALARTREAMHNSWDKNDPKDAQENFTVARWKHRLISMVYNGFHPAGQTS